MSKNGIADKKEPNVTLKGEAANRALNPLIQIGQAINNHAKKIDELFNKIESLRIDVKASNANMDIFDRRFKLIERQIDNIEKELINLKK